MTALQFCHLLLQSLNPCVNNINGWLNSPHENSSGNLTEIVQDELHSKTHTNKLLNRGPPLQDLLSRDSVNKTMLNVIHHAPQHLQEVLPGRTAKVESLHKVTMAAIDHHQVRSTILGDSEAMEIHIRRPRAPEIYRFKFIDLRLIKAYKKGCSLTHRVQDGSRTTAHLKLRRGSGKRTYQESIKDEMRNHGLRRTSSRGRNIEGNKGKETYQGQ